MSNREAGKGDSSRPIDLRTFSENWDKINWSNSSQSNSKYNTKSIKNSNRANTRRSQ
jgi:hypothetical protein